MDKILKLYTYVDGVNDTPFPSAEDPIEIGAFRYDAKRMGGAPIITASVNYPSCLDNEWTDSVYASFNGEKYYLKQTPTSSYDNVDTMYKHDLELVSERVILDDVYFFDAVVGNPQGEDKPVSNSTKVVFFGDVREFARRMNASLEYAKLLKWEDGIDEEGNEVKIPRGYHIVVDDDIVTEEKLMSFEDKFFSNVLQEIYNTYEVPYYFEGKTIHIGNSLPLGGDEEIPTFAYGVDDALLSITKNNANQKVVNRMTGTGSEDNIPFYYPNNSAKGEVAAISSRDDLKVKIIDSEKFGSAVDIDGTITFRNAECELSSVEVLHSNFTALDSWYSKGFYDSMESEEIVLKLDVSTIGQKSVRFGIDVKSIRDADGNIIEGANCSVQWALLPIGYSSNPTKTWLAREASQIVELPKMGLNNVYLRATIRFVDATGAPLGSSLHYADLKFSISLEDSEGWEYKEKMYDLKDLGLSVSSGTPISGDTITQTLVKYIKTSQNLMPSVYRATDGAERFYNAINYPFLAQDGYELQYGEYFKKEDKDGNPSDVNYVHNDIYKEADGTYIHFNNPYVEGRPKEHIITDENIKPTIKEAVNSTGLRMDMFSEFAYDLDDNDELIENEDGSEHEYVHSYFFGKLRKLDFNLFDHAIEQQPMTISFTSGDCGACNFEIGVTEEFPQKNPVQVNADGTLKRDEKGRVICGQFEDITEDECQPEQQDTINNEVWIALKKEDTTYGILMPKAVVYEEDGVTIKEAGHRPKACTQGNNDGDTFVILGINLPKSYILNAEKKVEAAIIKGLKENNDEKFTFSITFSRIYFEENPDVLAYLSENSKIAVTYNNETYDLYVSSYSYNMGEGEALPEIRVELDDTLKVSQNVLQNAINQVKSELGRAVNNIDVVGAVAPYFLRKDVDDEAQGKINFAKGVKFGEGGKVEVLDNNSAKLTIEYLEVTKKATFTSLEVQEKTHVGGQLIISPAAMTCGEVEELSDAYRCYFQTKGADDSDEIFNQFVAGDQAICQTYNSWGSRYYWRLVTGIGEDYIDLSKTDCDSDSDTPMSGDKIVQLGNRNDVTRQAAQVLSAHGDDAPSFVMYNGIDSFSLQGKNITGIIWNPETQEPQMYSYGSFFFGDRKLAGNYITFQQKDGEASKSLSINANVTIGAGSSGLSNLSEWKEKQEEIDAANTNANTANNNASIAITSATQAKTSAAQALSDANTAIQKAQNAESVANAAAANFESLVSDNTISPVEKQALRNELSNVLADYNDIQKQYQKYIVEFDVLILEDGKYYITEDGFVFNVQTANTNWAEYKAAYTAYKTDLEDKINTEGNVAVGQLMTLQSSYYESRTSILEDISLSIKAEADYSKVMAKSAKTIADDAKAAAVTLDAKVANVETGVTESVAAINARLDGVVENYFEEGDPTDPDNLNNPALAWDTDDKKKDHIGDTYTNIEAYVDNDTTPTAGKSWRWAFTDAEHTGYHWHPIADSDAVKALLEASKAKTAADGKSKNFITQPVPPYKEGDLWVQGDSGDIYRCKDGVNRTSGYFVSSEWELASKYTDDTKANAAQEDATKALADAAAAQSKADSAQAVADAAKNELDSWLEDGVITPVEKQALRNELESIKADYNDIMSDCDRYGIAFNVDDPTSIRYAYNNAYNTYADSLSSVINTSGVVDGEDVRESQGAYYTARTNILNAISEAAKKVADDAQSTADDAKTKADAAQDDATQALADAAKADERAQQAEGVANEAKSTLDALTADGVITKFEVQSFITERTRINAHKNTIDNDVNRYALGSSTSYTSYVSIYDLYSATLDGIIGASSFPMEVPAALTWRRNSYYESYKNVLNVIATAAKKIADDANNTLNSWLADGIITPVEKQGVRNEMAQVYNEYDAIYNDAGRYGLLNEQSWIVYEAEYSQYYEGLEGVLSDLESGETVNVSQISDAQGGYYEARTAILDLIESTSKAAVDGMEYLTNIFGNGKNLNVAGGVLAQMLAVSNSANEIEAFINGSNVGYDTALGKLLLAAGIENINEPEKAKTRIYEDGTIIVDAPNVSGRIVINDSGFKYYGEDNGEYPRVSLGDTCQDTIASFYDTQEASQYCVPATLLAVAQQKQYAIVAQGNASVSGSLRIGGGVVFAAGGNTITFFNEVLKIPEGMIAGLRPATRVINSAGTYTLTELDFSVLVNAATGTYYIALPSEPLDGQEYVIESRGATIKLTSTKQIWNHYYGKMEYSRDFVNANSVRFKYYAGANMWTCSWLDWKQA